MTKPRKLTTRQYVGLVRDLNSRMANLPPLFDESQVLEESELVDFLDNKAPKSHKAMLIAQGFNPETSSLATFVKHCERAETTDEIASAKSVASDEKSEPRKKKRTKTKSDRGKKRLKRSTKMYCSNHGENTSHNYKYCNTLKAKGKVKPKFSKKDSRKIPGNSISSRREPPLKRQSTSSTRASTRHLRRSLRSFWNSLKVTPQAARKKIPLVRNKTP